MFQSHFENIAETKSSNDSVFNLVIFKNCCHKSRFKQSKIKECQNSLMVTTLLTRPASTPCHAYCPGLRGGGMAWSVRGHLMDSESRRLGADGVHVVEQQRWQDRLCADAVCICQVAIQNMYAEVQYYEIYHQHEI